MLLRDLGRQLGDLGSGRVDVLVERIEREVDLPGKTVPPRVELAAKHDPGPHAGADREEDEVVHAPRHTQPPLAERGQVDVVLERDREPEAGFELGLEGPPLEPGHVGGELERPVRGARHSGHADDDAVDQLAGQVRRRHESVAKLGHRRERALRVGALELDVMARADRPAEVADRTAQKPRAEIEAEDERRLRNRLEVDGAVARPARSIGALSHEPGLHQRAERERDGRLRDPRAPRDLCARNGSQVAHELEHGLFVEALEERRRGRSRSGRFGHLVKKPYQISWTDAS